MKERKAHTIEFEATFQINKLTVFSVRYSTIGRNATPDFATQAALFVRSKRDYSRSGQCQDDVLPKTSAAYKFYQKWDSCRLHTLNDEQLTELLNDVEELKSQYNYIERTADSFGADGDGRSIRFTEVVELSKMEPKKVAKVA